MSIRKKSSISRRNFVTKLTAGTTGALLSVDAAARAFDFPRSTNIASGNPNNKKVRIGIVGGGFGANFYWHEHPDCIVTGVTDLQPKRRKKLQDTYKCDKVYNSMDEMLRNADDFDAIAVFTEPGNHARHSITALNAGKHVICAVPAVMTLEEGQELLDTVKRTGLVFMMAETSYWQQNTIAARNYFQEGKFGNLMHVDSMYQHDGSTLSIVDGKRTWRYGFPQMHYPTHCTAHYVGVTGDRLSEVSCIGYGDDSQYLKDNIYNNPFSNSTAMFKTSTGLPFHVRIWWNGCYRGAERAEWIGDKMSLYGETPNGMDPLMIIRGEKMEKDDGGFGRRNNEIVKGYEVPKYYLTDMLPKPLRHKSGHGGSHVFITHEFIDSIVNNHKPAVDVYEALAFTVPGIIAFQSALKGGELLKIPDFGRAK